MQDPLGDDEVVGPGETQAPLLNLNFRVRIEGMPEIGYCSVVGLESQIIKPVSRQDEDSEVGRWNGKVSYSNIILRRGFTDSTALWEWYDAVIHGKDDKRSGEIIVLNKTRKPAIRIAFQEALPCRWKLGSLDANNQEVLIEEIELVIKKFFLARGT